MNLIEVKDVELEILRWVEKKRLFIFRCPVSLLLNYMTGENRERYTKFVENADENMSAELISIADVLWSKDRAQDENLALISSLSRHLFIVVTKNTGEKCVGKIEFSSVEPYFPPKEDEGFFRTGEEEKEWMTPCFVGDLSKEIGFCGLDADKHLGGLTDTFLKLCDEDGMSFEEIVELIDKCPINNLNAILVNGLEETKEAYKKGFCWWERDEEWYEKLCQDKRKIKYDAVIDNAYGCMEKDGSWRYYLEIRLLEDVEVVWPYGPGYSNAGRYLLNHQFEIDITDFAESIDTTYMSKPKEEVAKRIEMLKGEKVSIFMLLVGVKGHGHKKDEKTYHCLVGYEIPDISYKKEGDPDYKRLYIKFKSTSDYKNKGGIPAIRVE